MNDKLLKVQTSLKAPKGQMNSFGNYKYRSCEDILEALKPLLNDAGLILTITDDIVEVGGRVYVKATATVIHGEYHVSVSAFARESESKKGMDDSQITGSASSYARKYALNGLFLIDDTKDADSMDNTKIPAKPPKTQEQEIVGELGDQFVAHGLTTPEAKSDFIQSVIQKDAIVTVLDAKRVLKALKDLADEESNKTNNEETI